jgi:hypothetical protein
MKRGLLSKVRNGEEKILSEDIMAGTYTVKDVHSGNARPKGGFNSPT